MHVALIIEDTASINRALLSQLRTRREELGLSQSALAERAGTSYKTVQRAEAVGGDPQLSTFTALCLGLGTSPLLIGAGGSSRTDPVDETAAIHRGLAHNRTKSGLEHRDRQREAVFSKSWEAVNEHTTFGLSPVMRHLVPGYSQEQASAAATAIQWLGSEVGFDFLERALEAAGYAITEKTKKSSTAK